MTSHWSNEYIKFVNDVGMTKSKEEEDLIVEEELTNLKTNLIALVGKPQSKREAIMKLIYCEMLGHEVEFGWIHAINFASNANAFEKRLGYVAVGLFLHRKHELLFLLINRMQQDLQSSNYLVVSAVLSALAKVISEETTPAILPFLTTKNIMEHPKGEIRKKFVIVIHAIYQQSKNTCNEVDGYVRKMLVDTDPSVILPCINLLLELIQDQGRDRYLDLVPALVSILKQVVDHTLPHAYDYNRLSAPWLQIKMLQVLALLGKGKKEVSHSMYEILRVVMKRSSNGTSMGNAIVYECVKTITEIHPSSAMLGVASHSLELFLHSNSPANLKYIGVESLRRLIDFGVKDNKQEAIIECLEANDESLQRKTLQLMYKITNPLNVKIITKRLLEFLKKTVDPYMAKELVFEISTLAEKFAPNPEWYIDAMNKLLLVGSKWIPNSTVQDMLAVISEDQEDGSKFQIHCVNLYYNMAISGNTVPEKLVQIMVWVLGEYSAICEKGTQNDIVQVLTDQMEQQYDDENTRPLIVSALSKAIARSPKSTVPTELISKCTMSKNTALCQRSLELLAMSDKMEEFASIIIGKEDIEVDSTLSFLNAYVQQAENKGARRYEKENFDKFLSENKRATSLKVKSYAPPASNKRAVSGAEKTNSTIFIPPSLESQASVEELSTSLRVTAKNKWTDEGYADDTVPVQEEIIKKPNQIWKDEVEEPVAQPTVVHEVGEHVPVPKKKKRDVEEIFKGMTGLKFGVKTKKTKKVIKNKPVIKEPNLPDNSGQHMTIDKELKNERKSHTMVKEPLLQWGDEDESGSTNDVEFESSLLSSIVHSNAFENNEVAFVRHRLDELSKSSSTDPESESNITVYKVFEDNTTVLVMQIDKCVKKVVVERVHPKSFDTTFERVTGVASNDTISLQPSTQPVLLIDVTLGSEPVVSETLMFKIDYPTESTSVVRSVKVSLQDMIRPSTTHLSETEFGPQWVSLKGERKVRIQNKSTHDGKDFGDAAFIHFNQVKPIRCVNHECILAMRVIGIEGNILVHAAVNWNPTDTKKSKILLSVRANQQNVSELVCKWANTCTW